MRFLCFIIRFAIWMAVVPAQQYPSTAEADEDIGIEANSFNERQLQSSCMEKLETCRSDLQAKKDECSLEPQPATESIFTSIWNFFIPPAGDSGRRYLQSQGTDLSYDECADDLDLTECQAKLDDFACTPSSTPSSVPSFAPSTDPSSIPSSVPTPVPTSAPSFAPSLAPTSAPSSTPSSAPSSAPSTGKPTVAPTDSPTSKPTKRPTTTPTTPPTNQPIVATTVTPTPAPSRKPTVAPTDLSTTKPTKQPTQSPTVAPTDSPVTSPATTPPTSNPTLDPVLQIMEPPTALITSGPTKQPAATTSPTLISVKQEVEPAISMVNNFTFYVIGDVPYTRTQQTQLQQQMRNLRKDADFLIHVGDIRTNNQQNCQSTEFSGPANILKLSPIPVMIVQGDNEYTDCPNRDDAVMMWKAEFLNFDSRFWNHSISIRHQNGYEENFSFIHKETLFIGLNIPGGNFETFWTRRLTAQLNWTKNLVTRFVASIAPRIGRIVVFAHAWPNEDHERLFFGPLATFISKQLNNKTPFLYIHGDGHKWLSKSNYLGQSSFYEIMVAGGTTDLPLKVTVKTDGKTASVTQAFTYRRYY